LVERDHNRLGYHEQDGAHGRKRDLLMDEKTINNDASNFQAESTRRLQNKKKKKIKQNK